MNRDVVIKQENLQKIIDACENPVDFEEVMFSVRQHENIRPQAYAIDPRNGALSLFCPGRTKRPDVYSGRDVCSVCEGDIPPVFLARKLPSSAYAFVTQNRFSFLNPDLTDDFYKQYGKLTGVNFLIWPTTEHKEIYEITYEDLAVSFDLIGEIEKRIKEYRTRTIKEAMYKHVLVIKNAGGSEISSQMHAQYQVAGIKIETGKKGHHWMWPKMMHEDEKFYRKNLMSFARYARDIVEDRPGLLVRDYGDAMLAVHPFMRRPLEAIIYPSSEVENICDLTQCQRLAIAKASADVASALTHIMPAMGKLIEYSFVFHNTGKGLYIEVLPATQRPGGYERARVYVNESNPGLSAEIYKRFFGNFPPKHDMPRAIDPSASIEYIKKEVLRR